jgi:hypothetical protein
VDPITNLLIQNCLKIDGSLNRQYQLVHVESVLLYKAVQTGVYLIEEVRSFEEA